MTARIQFQHFHLKVAFLNEEMLLGKKKVLLKMAKTHTFMAKSKPLPETASHTEPQQDSGGKSTGTEQEYLSKLSNCTLKDIAKLFFPAFL